MCGVKAADVKCRIGLRIAKPLSLAEADLERKMLGLHAREDVVAGAVEDAGDPLNRIAGQALPEGLDDGYSAADRRFEEQLSARSLGDSREFEPCAASIALFAETTEIPRESAALTASNATPSAPPINSTKMSMSAAVASSDALAK